MEFVYSFWFSPYKIEILLHQLFSVWKLKGLFLPRKLHLVTDLIARGSVEIAEGMSYVSSRSLRN